MQVEVKIPGKEFTTKWFRCKSEGAFKGKLRALSGATEVKASHDMGTKFAAEVSHKVMDDLTVTIGTKFDAADFSKATSPKDVVNCDACEVSPYPPG